MVPQAAKGAAVTWTLPWVRFDCRLATSKWRPDIRPHQRVSERDCGCRNRAGWLWLRDAKWQSLLGLGRRIDARRLAHRGMPSNLTEA